MITEEAAMFYIIVQFLPPPFLVTVSPHQLLRKDSSKMKPLRFFYYI